MKYSQLFTKTRKEIPSDEISKNAQLLIRAGYVNKHMAGVYEFLPLGLRVMNNISNIVRQEMNRVGGQEIKMTVLQDTEAWQITNRWSDEVVDNWFKTHLKNDQEIGLGFTHEEPLTLLMKEHIHSYRDMEHSVAVYQIQAKFRNEARAKSGILRGREFLMKDLYSFSRDSEQHHKFYESMQKAYVRIFDRVGLGEFTFLTFASGGSFAKYSHEFQTLTSAGEDIIYLDREKKIAVNKEVFTDDVLQELHLDKNNLEEVKAVEVGNIFTLGTRFAEPLSLFYETESGERAPVFMGSYGIGIGRLMGTVVEVLADQKGIIWPESIAPFFAHLISLPGGESSAEKLYADLSGNQDQVLYDERVHVRAGEKFADADLIGIPWRIVVSEKSLAQGGVEVRKRSDGIDNVQIIPLEKISLWLSEKISSRI